MFLYRNKGRQCCAAMLIVSVCLRLCMMLGLDEHLAQMAKRAIRDPRTAQILLYLETGVRPAVPELRPQVVFIKQPPQPEEPPPQPEEPPPETPVKTVDADAITVAGACSYSYDKHALLARPTAMDLTGSGPKILIVHSHTTESYATDDGLTYDPIDRDRTLDETRNMIAVGKVLVQELQALGVEVLHDTTVNDYPDYNSSYYNSLQRIEWYKGQYPGIQMVIDLHRDAVENEDGQAVALLGTHEGQTAAQLMLVVGTDEGGLEHPDWQENLANALKLQSVLQGECPELCRKLDLRTERFNQHTAPGAILVEVGTNGNTLTQAKASAVLLADAIAKTLKLMEKELTVDN